MDIAVRNAKILVMYSEGVTYQKIGEMYGISKQRVEQIVSRQYSISGERRRRATNTDNIVYPAIRAYFEENVRVGYSGFCRRAFGHYSTSMAHRIAHFFQGGEMLLTITQVKQICATIGKPFEEVFVRDDGKENEDQAQSGAVPTECE